MRNRCWCRSHRRNCTRPRAPFATRDPIKIMRRKRSSNFKRTPVTTVETVTTGAGTISARCVRTRCDYLLLIFRVYLPRSGQIYACYLVYFCLIWDSFNFYALAFVSALGFCFTVKVRNGTSGKNSSLHQLGWKFFKLSLV